MFNDLLINYKLTIKKMTTFKPCVQKARADGFYPVYIRVTHNRKIGYIKLNKVVSSRSLSKQKEIRDPFVLNYLSFASCTNVR
jgi:hypothetical protein